MAIRRELIDELLKFTARSNRFSPRAGARGNRVGEVNDAIKRRKATTMKTARTQNNRERTQQ
jgi:hypothetical protein